MSRRRFGASTLALAAPEVAFAQHAAVQGAVPSDTIWLNANENPEGPPPEAKEAISHAISEEFCEPLRACSKACHEELRMD